MTNTKGNTMRSLRAYVDQKNAWNAIFKGRQLDIDNAADRQRIASMIDSDLSPENLSCDGELSRSAVNAKYRQLQAAARELLKLDSSVKFYEFG
jgi:hypothetical protein